MVTSTLYRQEPYKSGEFNAFIFSEIWHKATYDGICRLGLCCGSSLKLRQFFRQMTLPAAAVCRRLSATFLKAFRAWNLTRAEHTVVVVSAQARWWWERKKVNWWNFSYWMWCFAKFANKRLLTCMYMGGVNQQHLKDDFKVRMRFWLVYYFWLAVKLSWLV